VSLFHSWGEEEQNDCLGQFRFDRIISVSDSIGLLVPTGWPNRKFLAAQIRRASQERELKQSTNMAQVAAPVVVSPVTATFQTFLSDPVFATYALCVVILTVKMVRATFRFQIYRF
jgi:hypothetical protein